MHMLVPKQWRVEIAIRQISGFDVILPWQAWMQEAKIKADRKENEAVQMNAANLWLYIIGLSVLVTLLTHFTIKHNAGHFTRQSADSLC